MSDDVDRDQSILVPYTFNSVELIEIEYQGKPVFLARQVGEALGYTDPDKLANNISQKWRTDFEEGRDFLRLSNGRLADFKAAVNCRPDRAVVDPRAPSLLLLTEAGAQLAAIVSRTAQGRAFRRWLLDVVLPQWSARQAPPTLPALTAALPATPALPTATPATSLDELRYRVDGLQRLALDGQAAGLLDRATGATLLTQAAALLVAGAGGRDGGGPLLPAVAMTGGEADAERPGLVPLAWATRFDALVARNQRSVPGLPRELEGQSPTDLWVLFGNVHHFLSDRAWRFLAAWLVEAGVVHYGRWLELFDAAGKEKRAAEASEPSRRRRAQPAAVPR